MKVAVTGASGFIGRHLVDALLAEGHEVAGLTRRAQPARPGLAWHQGDVTSGEGLAAAFEGADAVLHLVGIIRETREASFEAVHVEGTRRALEAARQAGVGRFLHMSALGADSESKSGYAATKGRAETLVAASALSWTIFRPSLAFGVGDDFFGGVLKGLVQDYPLVIPQVGRGDFRFRPVWVGDVASAFVQSLASPETVGRGYALVGPREYSLAELLQRVKETLGSRKPRLPVPLPLMRLAVPLMQVLPKPPITRDQFVMLLAGNTADPGPMREAFALEWRTLEEELPRVLAAS